MRVVTLSGVSGGQLVASCIEGVAPGAVSEPVRSRGRACRAELRGADAQQLHERNRRAKRVRDDRRVDEGRCCAQLAVDLGDEQRRRGNRCAVERGEPAQGSVVVLTRVADPNIGICGRRGPGPSVRRATHGARGAADGR